MLGHIVDRNFGFGVSMHATLGVWDLQDSNEFDVGVRFHVTCRSMNQCLHDFRDSGTSCGVFSKTGKSA